MDFQNLDWTYVRSFLAVADTGSLTAAARHCGLSQPTIGRHIKAVETALATELFARTATGLRLTESGAALLEPARDMATAYARLTTVAAGRDDQLSGTVRITASVVVSHYILPRIIAKMRQEEPEIEIELVPSDTTENLIFREADIAIRMYRPTQLDIVTRKAADHSIGLYASNALLERYGQPKTMDDLLGLPFVGFDRSDVILRTMREVGLQVDRHFFGVRCDDQATHWELVRQGCGIGAMQTIVADADPAVSKLDVQPPLPHLPVWLASHEALYHAPRVRRIWNLLIAALARRP